MIFKGGVWIKRHAFEQQFIVLLFILNVKIIRQNLFKFHIFLSSISSYIDI